MKQEKSLDKDKYYVWHLDLDKYYSGIPKSMIKEYFSDINREDLYLIIESVVNDLAKDNIREGIVEITAPKSIFYDLQAYRNQTMSVEITPYDQFLSNNKNDTKEEISRRRFEKFTQQKGKRKYEQIRL